MPFRANSVPTPTPTRTPALCNPVSHALDGYNTHSHTGPHENAYDGDPQTVTGEYRCWWRGSSRQSKVWAIYTFDSPLTGDTLHIDMDVRVYDGYGNRGSFKVDYKQTETSSWTQIWNNPSYHVS